MVRWEVTGQVWGTRAVVLPHMDMWLVGRGAWRGNVSSCMCGVVLCIVYGCALAGGIPR